MKSYVKLAVRSPLGILASRLQAESLQRRDA
jgi:hypothetical protein